MGISDLSMHTCSPITRMRRSHALEHATIQILDRRYPATRLAGRSTPCGFYIYGYVSAQDVHEAAAEALNQLQGGANYLAIHPRCGTNLVTAGTLVGLVTFLTMLPGSDRSRRERLPLVLLLSTLTLLFAQPLALFVQSHVTTEANLKNTAIASVKSYRAGRVPVHHVRLEHRTDG